MCESLSQTNVLDAPAETFKHATDAHRSRVEREGLSTDAMVALLFLAVTTVKRRVVGRRNSETGPSPSEQRPGENPSLR